MDLTCIGNNNAKQLENCIAMTFDPIHILLVLSLSRVTRVQNFHATLICPKGVLNLMLQQNRPTDSVTGHCIGRTG